VSIGCRWTRTYRTCRSPGRSPGSYEGIWGIRSRRRRCSVGSVITSGPRLAASTGITTSRYCGWAHRTVPAGMTASSITSARTCRRLSARAGSALSPSLWRRSSRGSGQPGTPLTNQGSRRLSSSGKNAASALTTSTPSTGSSGGVHQDLHLRPMVREGLGQRARVGQTPCTKAAIKFGALSNWFASCDQPEQLQAIWGTFEPNTSKRSSTVGSPRSQRHSPRRIARPATGGSSRCARSRPPVRWCSTTRGVPSASSKRS
jgi:hypothetical protein